LGLIHGLTIMTGYDAVDSAATGIAMCQSAVSFAEPLMSDYG